MSFWTIPVYGNLEAEINSEDDMFSEDFKSNFSAAERTTSCIIEGQDDRDGYYCPAMGERLKGSKYEVTEIIGRGVFGSVVKAVDLEDESKKAVAIKIIRLNMQSSGYKESSILQKISETSLPGKKYILLVLDRFDHKGHLCLVLELLSSNLRELLRKYGEGVGLSLNAVRVYSRQLLQALAVLEQIGIIHCDIKPDNILVSSDHSSIRLCDFGTAIDEKNELPIIATPYLASRFYRAPEIILGKVPITNKIDLWSLGCTLYELFTGSILFPGTCNNDMLCWMMMYKGKFSPKMLRRCSVASDHFLEHDNWAYLHQMADPVTKLKITRLETPTPAPTKSIRKTLVTYMSLEGSVDPAQLDIVGHFADFLEKLLILNPEQRFSIQEALQHPFVQK